jgi:hypothetical protein
MLKPGKEKMTAVHKDVNRLKAGMRIPKGAAIQR